MGRSMKWFAAALFGLQMLCGSVAPALAQGAAPPSAIEEIKKRGTLVVGLSTFVPWAMRSKSGELIGYEVDVAKKLAEDMGVKAELVPTAWDGIIPALLAGKFDFIIGGMTITPARNLTVNFTQPYSATGVDIAANKKLASGFAKLEDFNKASVTLVARRGSSAASAATRFFPKATLRQFDDDAQAILEVVNGRAHAVLASVPKPAFAVFDNADALIKPFPEPFVKQADAMAVRKGDVDSLNFLNNWIMVRTLDGWLEDRQTYWFKNREWLNEVAPAR